MQTTSKVHSLREAPEGGDDNVCFQSTDDGFVKGCDPGVIFSQGRSCMMSDKMWGVFDPSMKGRRVTLVPRGGAQGSCTDLIRAMIAAANTDNTAIYQERGNSQEHVSHRSLTMYQVQQIQKGRFWTEQEKGSNGMTRIYIEEQMMPNQGKKAIPKQ